MSKEDRISSLRRRTPSVRNALLSLCSIVFLLGPFALYAVDFVRVELPSWFTSEEAIYLTGSNYRQSVGSKLSLECLSDGSLQDALEDDLEDHIPCKARAMVAGAALQRKAIVLSNVAFKWNAYPTYYGRSELVLDDLGILGCSPAKRTDELVEGIRSFAVRLAVFAEKQPDVRFSVVVPTHMGYMDANPAWSLVSNTFSMNDCIELLDDHLAELPNVEVVGKPYDGAAELLENGYATDAHWNGFGAIRTFNLLAEMMQVDGLHDMGSEQCLEDGYIFNGQLARQGLMLFHRNVNEPALDVSGISINEDSQVASAQIYDREELPIPQDMRSQFNFYASWYGQDAECVMTNVDGGNSDIVAFVSDSFGDAFRWPLALRVSEVHDKRHMQGGSRGDQRCQDVIDEVAADHIVFVGSISNIASFVERYPYYFDH